MHGFQDAFTFGIPSDKQEKANVLLSLVPSFIREDIYKNVVKKQRELAKKETWKKAGWEEELEKTFLDECEKDRLTREELNKVDLSKATAKERQLWNEKHWALQDNYKLNQHPYVSVFFSNYKDRIVRGIYGKRIIEIIEGLKNFNSFTNACYHNNTILLPTHNLIQNGDRERQQIYGKLIYQVSQKLREIEQKEMGE